MLTGQDFAGPDHPRIIEGLFVHQDAIIRHLSSPQVAEREAYFAELLASGQTRKYISERATIIRQVIRVMEPFDRKAIDEDDISKGAMQWNNKRVPGETIGRLRREECFKAAARSWFRFLGTYVAPSRPYCRFVGIYKDFSAALHEEFGYLPATITAASIPTRSFLEWISSRHQDLSAISLTDVDDFISEGRAQGWSNRTVKGKCEALRVFFRYAERRGWSHRGLSKTIKAPITNKHPILPYCPKWDDIRRLIGALDDSVPFQCRAKAIMLLASVYGMRSCEITRLTFEDIDWYNEVLTVRRAKHGRVQQFPMQYEVGQAIISYLKNARPTSKFRNVFLTLHGPPRPIHHLSQSMWRLLRSGVFSEKPFGLHSLRHACATELLRKGTSLKGIADFLGHRSLRSVSIYAHCDIESLRKVADFSLRDVL